MTAPGGVAPSVLETLEFPAALERVAVHAAGPLGAARVRSRTPVADVAAIGAALAQVAELAALLLRDDAIRAEPVPDIGPALALLAVPGSALDGPALAGLGRALVAARIVAADLGRLAADAPRTAALRAAVPPKTLETRLAQSLDPDGQLLDGASRGVPRARYAVLVNGFAPAIATGPLEIHDGRHPLLVGGEVVPFDLVLAPDEFTVLISGPNTGGKTVLIKAVGLLCLMAQSGIVPPIGPQSTLPVFDGVFADIGDRQSIAASLSTFSAHVAVLRDMLERAGAGSLVLLDEIGSGTDPAEGGALAAAVLKTLARRRA